MEASMTTPVVVDLWAEWCGPCKTLGPILEKVVGDTNGAVKLVKVDVDANPRVAQAFQVQSIPAIFAIHEGKIVDSFTGAMPEHQVREFVDRLAPDASPVTALVRQGDEQSLAQALALEPNNVDVLTAMAQLWLAQNRYEDVVTLLEPHRGSNELTSLAAQARLAMSGVSLEGDLEGTLEGLLAAAKGDEDAKSRLLQILDALGPTDPMSLQFRRRLASILY
jgi:putative thioredoxin